MTTATLTFTLPDDAEALRLALDGANYRNALVAYQRVLRDLSQSTGGALSAEHRAGCRHALGLLAPILAEAGVTGEDTV